MKRLSLYLFLVLFTLQTPSWTDNIRDFQIEGMSIGESLLDYMSENEIKKNKRNYVKNRKYYVVGEGPLNLKTYDQMDIYLKSGDETYEIKSLSGMLVISGKKCLDKKNEIVNELKQLFKNIKVVNYKDTPHVYDKTGKSTQQQTGFLLKNDDMKDNIRVECTDWSKKIEKEKNWLDNLSVSATTTEIYKWIDGGYR